MGNMGIISKEQVLGWSVTGSKIAEIVLTSVIFIEMFWTTIGCSMVIIREWIKNSLFGVGDPNRGVDIR